MLSIQIISLIVFVISIVIIPVIDHLFFYSAFNFKGSFSFSTEKERSDTKENVTAETLERAGDSSMPQEKSLKSEAKLSKIHSELMNTLAPVAPEPLSKPLIEDKTTVSLKKRNLEG